MLTLQGKVFNVFDVSQSVNRDGEIREGHSKVQICGEIPLRTGGVKYEMFDLKTDRAAAFRAALGQIVRVPVQPYAFAGEGGGIISGLSTPKGVEIELIDKDGKKTGLLASTGKAA